MTMTAFVSRSDDWTVDDLADLPEDGNRYEILDGSLFVSPMPALPHGRVVSRLHRSLVLQAPDTVAVVQNMGVLRHLVSQTYLVPDLMIILDETLDRAGNALRPNEALVVVEVISPRREAIDLVTKRHYYATMEIPQYWVVDPVTANLMVMRTPKDGAYREEIGIDAGATWATDDPFSLSLNPADFR
jgi:Uma2 family endonuclease